MPYVGGKHFQGSRIAEFILNKREGKRIVEPFCGSLAVTYRLGCVSIASDSCLPLITLLKAVQNGWVPPDYVSREDYDRYRAIRDPLDPMTAFVGFWHSFGGKWFGGYQRYWNGEPHPMPKPGGAAKAVMKAVAKSGPVELRHCDYRDFSLGAGDIAYLDPPYEGTTSPGEGGKFDSFDFWSWVRDQERRGADCYVSEAQAPDDFEPVLTLKAAKRLAKESNSGHRGEYVFKMRR